jgi:hypothetical protein
MGYVAWLKANQEYNYHHIKKLTQYQFNNFITLFFTNKKQAEYILFKKLYKLFDSCDLETLKEKELIKLNKISEIITLNVAIRLFNKINYQNINLHNVKKLLLFLKDEDNIKKNKINIEWGPGNNKNKSNNIKEHFIKHVLSEEEGLYWNLILDKIDSESYANYAINNFYKMENVIVHTDGINVYLSGFYGNIFIVGRYHGDVFGISSCYYVEKGEKNGRYKNLCFEINFDKI